MNHGYQTILSSRRRNVTVHSQQGIGPLEWWRQSVGHGGINSRPMPSRVVRGVEKLRPRLVRIFIQEFFGIYPEHERFDFGKLDPYMESLAGTGAQVEAAITIKPRPLYPTVDETIWRPSDVKEWQRVVFELVKRYSVDKKIVSHWEIGNETNIGERGGCPYLIEDPRDYGEYYAMTIAPVLQAFPQAKVGGPATAGCPQSYLKGWLDYCQEHNLQVDFASWHQYTDNAEAQIEALKRTKALVATYPGLPRRRGAEPGRIETHVTEWSKSFDPVSVEDLASHPRRAALIAGALLAYVDEGCDYTFYYHIWDQVAYASEFAPIFARPAIMTTHWNEIPHRFGLFGVEGEVRPQYFAYQMLHRLGEERLAAESEDSGIRVLAARSNRRVSAMLVNYDLQASHPTVVTVRIPDLATGRRMLTVYRIDEARRWSEEDLELIPLEKREVDVPLDFRFQVFLPGDSVAMAVLEEID